MVFECLKKLVLRDFTKGYGLLRSAISGSSPGWQCGAQIGGMGWREPGTVPSNTVATSHMQLLTFKIK